MKLLTFVDVRRMDRWRVTDSVSTDKALDTERMKNLSDRAFGFT